MKHYILSAILAVAAIGLVLTASPATAAEELWFKTTLESKLWGVEGDVWTYGGTGNVPHMGWCWHVDVVTLDLEADPNTAYGTNTITAHDGDQLYIEIEQVWVEAKWRWEGTYTITGGTGKFEGATGSGRIMAKPTPWWGAVAEYEGTITY